MSTINNGNQILTFDYLQEGRSQSFNKLNHLLFDQGMMSGGVFSKVSNTEITIDPLVAIIRDDTNEVTVRLETTSTASVTVTNTTTYIIARLEWINTEDNYVDFLAVAESSIQNTDIILGRLIFSGTTLSTTFDYTQKEWHPWKNIFDNKEVLKVYPSEPYAMTLEIEAGNVYINGILVEFVGTTLGTITAPSADPRIDLISIDNTGTINITTGNESAIPIIPDFPGDELVLAYITLQTTSTFISGDMITAIEYNAYFTSYNGTSTNFKNGLDGTEGSPITEFGKSGKHILDRYATDTEFSTGLIGGSGTTIMELIGKAIYDMGYANFQTGDIFESTASTKIGFIPAHGETVGDSSSGADYAGDDYQALFNLYNSAGIWGNPGSAVWGDHDTVLVPDLRNITLYGANASTRAVDSITQPATPYGTEHADQMQQITGTITKLGGDRSPCRPGQSVLSGAFSEGSTTGDDALDSGSDAGSSLEFDSADSPNARTGANTMSAGVGIYRFIKI